MSNLLSLDEITILSIQDGEMYCYIKKSSSGKEWPDTIVHLGLHYELEAKWDLPVEMKSYIQAARYLLLKP